MAISQLQFQRPGFVPPSVSEVKKRVEVVGPLLRYVLGMPFEYEARKKSVVLTSSKQFFEDLEKVNIFNIPEEAGKFITVVLKGTDPVYNTAEWKFVFLSDFAMEVVRKAVHTNLNVEALKTLGMDFLIAEYATRQYFKGEWDRIRNVWVPSDSNFNLNECDICIDVGSDQLIKSPRVAAHKLALMKLLPRWDREIVFRGKYLKKDVDLLAPGCLYRPHSHNFALADAVVGDHREKKVFFIQSAAKDVEGHIVNLSTLKTVMTNLGMLSDGTNGDYTLWIIFCADWSRARTHGSCFTTTVEMSAEIQHEKYQPLPDPESSLEQKSEESPATKAGKKPAKLLVSEKGANVKEYNIDIKFFKHSSISEEGNINHDFFNLSATKKSWHEIFQHENLYKYLTPVELSIMMRCHVLIVRCNYYPSLIKHELNSVEEK